MIMSGNTRFLISFRTLLLCSCDWLYNIWFLVFMRLRIWLMPKRIWKSSRCPFASNWSVSQTKKMILKCELNAGGESRKQRFKDIPISKGWPLIGTTLDMIAAGSAPNLHKYIDRRHQQYGEIFRERLGGQEVVFVSSANLMRSVFLYEGQYPIHPLPDSWVLYNKLHNCQRGLFFMNGHEWHVNRKIMNRLLLNGNLNWMNEHIEFCTVKLIHNWKTAAKQVDGYFRIENLEGQLYRWAIDVVSAIMFGNDKDNTSEELNIALYKFSKNVHKIFENSAHLMTVPPKLARALHMKIWLDFEKNVTEVLRMGHEIINLHMNLGAERGSHGGLFSRMISAGMSLEVIKRIFVDLIIAAGDTTAFSTQWVLYLLSQDKTIQEKIRCEYFSDGSEGQTVCGLIKETLRLYPVAPFIGRILNQDGVIGDYEIKKNTMVILSLYTSGRNPDYFPNPMIVKPERWIRDSSTELLKDVLQPHGTLPFAIGSRSCIGRKVALRQMQSLVSMFASTFETKCFNKMPIDVVLRLVAVPSSSLELGIKIREE